MFFHPFIYLSTCFTLLRFQTSMDMIFLSQLAYFVMQRFPAANFQKNSCSINAAIGEDAGSKGKGLHVYIGSNKQEGGG